MLMLLESYYESTHLGKGGNVMRLSLKKRGLFSGKILFEKVIMFFLYRGMKTLYKYDSRVYKEIESWPMGRTIVLTASKRGPKLCLERVSSGIVRPGNIEDPDILISFKSIDGAFLVFSGQMGITEAYAQHRFMVKGDIAEIMSIVRCIELAEVYLFPKIITKRILRRVPGKQLGSFRVYCHSLFGF